MAQMLAHEAFPKFSVDCTFTCQTDDARENARSPRCSSCTVTVINSQLSILEKPVSLLLSQRALETQSSLELFYCCWWAMLLHNNVPRGMLGWELRKAEFYTLCFVDHEIRVVTLATWTQHNPVNCSAIFCRCSVTFEWVNHFIINKFAFFSFWLSIVCIHVD